MKYTIVSIDDSRNDKKADIRSAMHEHEEVLVESFNGADDEQMHYARQRWPGIEPVGWNLSRGELGIWYSQIACWQWAAKFGDLIVYEDDAIVNPEFDRVMRPYIHELPEDYDFFSLFVPDNQMQDFWYSVVYDAGGAPMQVIRSWDERYNYNVPGLKHVVRVYQGYSCVANMYSQKGAQKLLDRLSVKHMYSPADCFVYMEAHQGILDGYAHHPDEERPVVYDWNVPSIRVQEGYV